MASLIAQYFLNHRLDLAEVEWQMQEFARQGYEGVYAHARPGMLTPYFSEDWWRVIDKMVEVCERVGMEFWIWDEDYFPSGLCGGRVLWTDPGLAARELRFKVVEVSGAGPFEVDFEQGMLVGAWAVPVSLTPCPSPMPLPTVAGRGENNDMVDISKYCGTRRQWWGPRYMLHRAYSPGINPIGHPHWRSSMEENRFAVVWTPEEPGDYLIVGVTEAVCSADHPDLLRPEGVRLFLELSHEEYARRYGDRFGKTIRGSFTDEPSPGSLLFPWSPVLPAEFDQDHGYSLVEHLPHLALDLDERSAAVRHHYRQTQHRLVKANYVDQVGAWCHEHGLKSIGHLTRTEWLSLAAVWWPNELRCYENMDIPCADPLGASVGFKDAASYHTGLKVVSSAAELFGKEQAGADCVAVIGDEGKLRDLKYLFDYHMVMGINHFTVHGLSYSNDGPRKDEVPPSIFYQHTEWKHMKVLADHVRETAAALTGGRQVCDIAMLYPSTSLYCQARLGDEWMNLEDEGRIHGLVEEMLCRQKDFCFVDEEWLATAERSYAVVVLPYLQYIDQQAAEGLRRFAATGGRVICVGHVPVALTEDLNAPVAEWAEDAAEFVEAPEEEWLAALPGASVEGDGARDVFVLRRDRDGKRIVFAFNRGEEAFWGTVEGVEVEIAARGSVLMDDGSLTPAPLPVGEGERREASGHEINADWEIEFEANQLPLSFWHCGPPGGLMGTAFTAGQPFDLMRREADPQAGGEGVADYYCRFMLTGEISDAQIVIEDSTITGEWTMYVNDQPVSGWERSREMDCLNWHAPVGALLRGGTSPVLNVVRVETTGTGRGLHEVMYLYGAFTCEYRYGHLSYPFVKGASEKKRPPISSPSLKGGESDGHASGMLQSWDVLGYPTFSGTATYRRRFTVEAQGDYVLDLGRVEDVAAVAVDGLPVAVLAWEPYRVKLAGLAAGEHELQIEVTNAPANRNRAAGLPAGLLGPVRVRPE